VPFFHILLWFPLIVYFIGSFKGKDPHFLKNLIRQGIHRRIGGFTPFVFSKENLEYTNFFYFNIIENLNYNVEEREMIRNILSTNDFFNYISTVLCHSYRYFIKIGTSECNKFINSGLSCLKVPNECLLSGRVDTTCFDILLQILNNSKK